MSQVINCPIYQKDPEIRVPKITRSAKGKECQFKIPGVCNGNPETTVWCHSDESEDGKGYGHKAHDIFGAFGCAACHHWYDNGPAPREEKRFYFNRAMKRSWKILWREGVIR